MKQYADASVNGVVLRFEIGTGSPVVLIGDDIYNKFFNAARLSSLVRLFGAGGEAVPVIGSFVATLGFGKKSGNVPVVVQAHERQVGLLGVPGLDVLFPGWRRCFAEGGEVNILKVDLKFDLSRIKDFKNVILENYGGLVDQDFSKPIKDVLIGLDIVEGASPVFSKARKVPFSIRDQLTEHIQDSVRKGFHRPVKTSLWASPIVVVRKKDGSIRMCIDPTLVGSLSHSRDR